MSLFREKLIILLMVSVGSGFEVMPTSCVCNNSLMSASHDSPGYSPKIYYVECVSSLFVRRLVIYRTVLEGVLQRAAATVRVN